MAAMIRMAIERGLFLHAHADRDAIERLLAQADGLTVIWAHAGFDVPTTELADRYRPCRHRPGRHRRGRRAGS